MSLGFNCFYFHQLVYGLTWNPGRQNPVSILLCWVVFSARSENSLILAHHPWPIGIYRLYMDVSIFWSLYWIYWSKTGSIGNIWFYMIYWYTCVFFLWLVHAAGLFSCVKAFSFGLSSLQRPAWRLVTGWQVKLGRWDCSAHQFHRIVWWCLCDLKPLFPACFLWVSKLWPIWNLGSKLSCACDKLPGVCQGCNML